jgi:chemotaxis protein CheD
MMQAFSMLSLYLKPGEYYFDDQPARIQTVLGSCIAVSMYHRFSGLAALCHVIAPDCASARSCSIRCVRMSRYVRCMIPAMARSYFFRRINAVEIEVKLFGGATMIQTEGGENPKSSVGKANLAAAYQIIDQYGLKLKADDGGGSCGRKIIFDTRTGEVLLKRILPA